MTPPIKLKLTTQQFLNEKFGFVLKTDIPLVAKLTEQLVAEIQTLKGESKLKGEFGKTVRERELEKENAELVLKLTNISFQNAVDEINEFFKEQPSNKPKLTIDEYKQFVELVEQNESLKTINKKLTLSLEELEDANNSSYYITEIARLHDVISRQTNTISQLKSKTK